MSARSRFARVVYCRECLRFRFQPGHIFWCRRTRPIPPGGPDA